MSYSLSLASWYLGFTVIKTQIGKFKSVRELHFIF